MLQLERNRNQRVDIALKGKSKTLNRVLLQAFGIALILHLCAGILFQVRHLFRFDEQILPPVIVQADLSPPPAATMMTSEISNGQRRVSFHPVFSDPELPAPQSLDFIFASEEKLKNKILRDLLMELEENWYGPVQAVSADPVLSSGIEVAGPIASIPLLNLEEGIGFCVSAEEGMVRYNVRLENRTGRIFWYDPVQSPLPLALQQQAQKILEHLRFQPSEGFVSAGEITLCFRTCLHTSIG